MPSLDVRRSPQVSAVNLTGEREIRLDGKGGATFFTFTESGTAARVSLAPDPQSRFSVKDSVITDCNQNKLVIKKGHPTCRCPFCLQEDFFKPFRRFGF